MENRPGSAACSACRAPLVPPPPPGPVRKNRSLWIVAIVVLGGLFLAAALCGVLALSAILPTDVETSGSDGNAKIQRAGDGYSTPEKALDAEAKNLLSGDWVFYTVEETDDYVEYWIGPQNAQFEKGVIVTKLVSGKWVASDVYTLDLSQQASGGEGEEPTVDESEGDTTTEGDPTDDQIAVYVVTEYLTALSEGRGDDAYAMTMPPLSDAGPDAMTGDFEMFEVFGAEIQEDGSIWVTFTLEWPDEARDMGALVQLDADGVFYISDVSELGAE